MSFNNVYYKRTAGTAKACYVCYKPTTTVLATMNTTDFIYTCAVHLTDRGFASVIEQGPKKVTDEEIAKVKEEWEEKQKKKEEKEGEKKEKEGEKEEKKVTVPAPVHERYALHRDFFAMRERAHRKRRQAAEARELGPRLPGAPSGVFSGE